MGVWNQQVNTVRWTVNADRYNSPEAVMVVLDLRSRSAVQGDGPPRDVNPAPPAAGGEELQLAGKC